MFYERTNPNEWLVVHLFNENKKFVVHWMNEVIQMIQMYHDETLNQDDE